MLDQSTALFRRSSLGFGAAVVVLIGAGVSFALNAKAAGYVLIVVAVLCAVAGFAVTVAAYSKSKVARAALMRDAMAEQRRTGGAAPDARER